MSCFSFSQENQCVLVEDEGIVQVPLEGHYKYVVLLSVVLGEDMM